MMAARKQYEPLDPDAVEFAEGECAEKASGKGASENAEPKPIPPVNEDGIADEMKEAGVRWCMWHGVWQPEKGKYDKYPCKPNGKHSPWKDPKYWLSYEDAIDGHLADPGKVSGVGFFTGYDEEADLTYWLYDDDHRINGGTIDPKAQAILDGFPYGYRELSVGMDGFHIVFATSGKCKGYGHNPDDSPSELYNHKHFATVTGNEYQNNGHPFVAPISAVEKLIDLAKLPKLVGEKAANDENDAGTQKGAGDSPNDAGDTFNPLGGEGEPKGPTDADVKRAASYLAVIPASVGYETWLRVGMALHSKRYPCELWEAWSRKDPTKFNEGECQRKWESFGNYEGGDKISFGYLVDLAYRNGWLPSNPPVEGPFYLASDGRTLWRAPKSKNGYATRVTASPPYILAKIESLDPGTPARVRVGMDLEPEYGKSKQVTFVLDRSDLFDKKALYKTLTDLGGNLSESNAANVVEYLTVCDGARWSANLPHEVSTSHMGWVGEPLGVFMPYDEGKTEIRFDPQEDKASISAAFQEPKGTLREWIDLVGPLRDESVILRALIAASFVSVLLEVLGIQPFIVYVWGLSGYGKTISLMIAGSPWGDTAEGAGYYAKLSDTDTSIFQRAGQLHNIPIILDEFQTIRKPTKQSKRDHFQQLSYDLSYGVERNRSNRSLKYKQGSSWKLVTLSAGEESATDDTTGQGALNRIIEISGEPFKDKRKAEAAHRALPSQHGHAGRAFIEYIKGWDAAGMRGRFDAVRADVLDAVPDHPQTNIMAALAFGDLLAELALFNPSAGYDEARASAVKFVKLLSRHTKGASEQDTDRRAIEYMAEWLATNEKNHFKENRSLGVIFEPYGKFSEVENVWYVMTDKLTKALEQNGFSREKTIKKMGDEGILRKPAKGKGWQERKSVGTPKPYPYCYAIDGEALDKYIEEADDES